MNASLFVTIGWLLIVAGYAAGFWFTARDFGRIWAIARHTFTEALRSKILLVVILFTIVLIGSSPFFPALRPIDRVGVVTSVSTSSITFFLLVVSIFIAASALPREIENHAI